jgi:hypothetical protein
VILLKREKNGWAWPKTVLDFAASIGLARDDLDLIMRLTTSMFGARGPRVAISSALVPLGQGRTCEKRFLTFATSLPPGSRSVEEELRTWGGDWSEALWTRFDGRPYPDHLIRLSLLPPEPYPPEA